MENIKIKKISEVKFKIEKEQQMNGGVVFYSTEDMLEKMKKDSTVQQAINASKLPGIVGDVLVMPDGHQGYGFPVGGVAAFDAEEGIISPGAVGFDINCGVRLIKTSINVNELKPKIKELSDTLFKTVPTGVGSKLNLGFKESDLELITKEGVKYAVEKGYGVKDDIQRIEEHGRLDGADFSKVSKDAKKRGLNQLGTLGAGNHFLEIQKVEKIFDENIAKAYGLEKDQIVIMVHTGSRGFGHQICSDFLRTLLDYQQRNNIQLPDKELSYAKVGSKEAQNYIMAMNCAVNFAFTNRQIITHLIRKSFSEVFGKDHEELGMELLYDVAHNIAKHEEHTVNGEKRRLYIHRKGATRAFPKGTKELPSKYRVVGQPVIIPGSMSTGSYILCGMENSMKESFGSACHGSGRLMSRHQALREIPSSKTFNILKEKDIEIRVRTRKLISEEAEWAYKNPDEVVSVVERAGLAKIVSKNKPLVVIKG
ncbi:MAG: RtcB family protein [Candidatus Micrarchaeaceae archaeon]